MVKHQVSLWLLAQWSAPPYRQAVRRMTWAFPLGSWVKIMNGKVSVLRERFSFDVGEAQKGFFCRQTFCPRFSPNAAHRGDWPWQGRLSDPSANRWWQFVKGVHGVARTFSPPQAALSEIAFHTASSRSNIRFSTSTRRVSVVPSIGGERCNRRVSGYGGQSMPHSKMGVPIGTVKI